MQKHWVFILLVLFLSACGGADKTSEKKKQVKTPAKKATVKTDPGYKEYLPSIVKIQSFDNGRVLESGQGFFVEEDVIVTRFSLMQNANQATIRSLNSGTKYKVSGYLAIDRINDLILLKTDEVKQKPIPLFVGTAPNTAKTIYLTRPQNNTVPLHRGKILDFSNVNGNKLYRVTNKFRSPSYGTPLFVSNKKAIGICFAEVVDYEQQYFVIPSTSIAELLKKKSNTVLPLHKISSIDKAVSEANSKIKGLLIETDLGNIKIRLFNETPAYRDNFIKLTRENYFDSLLIHRVIKGFCIQSGAADTRHAGKDDIVGWKGPGYTLPAHIVPKFYHKRGMIGSPRKPDTKNSKRRSDGSQFYIVTGRVYGDTELNEIEQENNIKFTEEQRLTYKIEGGAPHIDGTYTIFGEVLSGMDIADKIVQKETDTDFRPLEDIRIKKITILE